MTKVKTMENKNKKQEIIFSLITEDPISFITKTNSIPNTGIQLFRDPTTLSNTWVSYVIKDFTPVAKLTAPWGSVAPHSQVYDHPKVKSAIHQIRVIEIELEKESLQLMNTLIKLEAKIQNKKIQEKING